MSGITRKDLEKIAELLQLNSLAELKAQEIAVTLNKLHELSQKQDSEAERKEINSLYDKVNGMNDKDWNAAFDETNEAEEMTALSSSPSNIRMLAEVIESSESEDSSFFITLLPHEDQAKTLDALNEAYVDITGQRPAVSRYENQAEFLNAAQTLSLPKSLTSELAAGSFPLEIKFLKFTSEQFQKLKKETLGPLAEQGKLTLTKILRPMHLEQLRAANSANEELENSASSTAPTPRPY